MRSAQSLRDWRELASEMVDKEIVAAGVTNERVIRAMRDTPRHEFVPANQRRVRLSRHGPADRRRPDDLAAVHRGLHDAGDRSAAHRPRAGDRHRQRLPGGRAQPAGERRVHDRDRRAAQPAARRATLKRLGYKNVFTRAGDGYKGWPEAAPFDKIIVTCSPEEVPQPLVDQLREGGLMIIPVGERYQQNLYLMRKVSGKLKSEALRATLFVPMTGEAEAQRAVKPDPEESTNRQRQLRRRARRRRRQQANGRTAKEPAGWHYQRQLTLQAECADAPDGKSYVTFHNAEPGRGSHALQGFAVDGREVSTLRLILLGPRRQHPPRRASQTNCRRSSSRSTTSAARRSAKNRSAHSPAPSLGVDEDKSLRVPLRAREAILRIGLLGAVGELSLDDLRLQPQRIRPASRQRIDLLRYLRTLVASSS